MSNEPKGQPYLKGKFTGLFKQKGKKPTGNFIFSDIHWTYLKIENCEKLNDFDTESQKTGDYWYSDRIYHNKGFRPFRKKTDVFIPHGENEFVSGDLYKVLIKNLKINHEKSYFLSKDWQEASGDIYFQLSLPPKPKKEKKAQSTNSTVSGTNMIENGIPKTDVNVNVDSSTVLNDHVVIDTNNGIADPPPVIPSTSTTTGRWSKWISGIISFLIYALIIYYLWKWFPALAYIFIGLLIIYWIGKLFNRFPLLRTLAGLAIFGFIGYFLYNLFYLNKFGYDPVKTRDGRVKVSPPKRTDNKKDGMPDYATDKEIEWYDFINQNYLARYSTSQVDYENSVEQQDQLQEKIKGYSNSVEFFTRYYNGLYQMDEQKINEVASIFIDSANKKQMTPIETAEMVVTFIQEIPYYLVHEGTCQQSIESGNEFVVDYHRDQKPCIPNVAAGVQSPYEFLHNLKGDCDTRTLLGHALLSKLNIASSIWVSEAYGHSILGVAVPVGNGIYKEINGVKHYGVELTAKGFRLGMVAPEHARPGNWDITLYNNHS
jgi:hypothetical protein